MARAPLKCLDPAGRRIEADVARKAREVDQVPVQVKRGDRVADGLGRPGRGRPDERSHLLQHPLRFGRKLRDVLIDGLGGGSVGHVVTPSLQAG